MSNVVLIKPYKLFFKGNWFVYDCQNRESATGKNEIEADRILAANMSQYLIRLTIESEKGSAMSEPVERFSFSVEHEIAYEDVNGDWVKFAAYEALKAKVECLEGKIELDQAKLRGEEETVKRVVAHSEALKAENEELRKQAERYEKLRKLNVQEFAEIFRMNAQGGVPFDEIIDGVCIFTAQDIGKDE